ncbi:MAG: hypothetical protein ABWX70_04655 [Hyphomicrobium sp.]
MARPTRLPLRATGDATSFAFGASATLKLFSMLATTVDGIALSAVATRVASVRSTLASAGAIVFIACSILPDTGANIDVDMASNAIAIIMPPWA